MALEIARIDVLPDRKAEFEAGFAQAKPLFLGARGCRSIDLLRSYEVSTRYWLLVAWINVADHEAFRETADFQTWRELVGHCFADAPAVEHGLAIEPTPRR